MCTFLGTAGKVSDEDVNADLIKKAEITFLEGYLWDEGEPKKAFDKAISNANKVAMSLSDQFCVDRHKIHFLNLVQNGKINYKWVKHEIIKLQSLEGSIEPLPTPKNAFIPSLLHSSSSKILD